MTPKEKAQELVLKYLKIENTNDWWSKVPAKQCALIAVDEILKAFYLNTGSDIVGNHVINFAIKNSDYWEEVKQEIELL